MYFNPKSRWLRGITVAMIMLWLAFGGQTFAFGQAAFSFMGAAHAEHDALPTTETVNLGHSLQVVGSTLHVTTSGSDFTGDGTEANPFATIQHGMDTATSGDIVSVHPGTYVENINFNGKNITVESTDGPDSTIIDGNQNGSVVTFENGETSSAVLNGFTLLNGNGTELTIWSYPHHYGGGIYSNGSTPNLVNLVVSSNSVDGGGGGIFLYSSSPALINVTITDNSAGQIGSGGEGGGMAATFSSSPILTNVTISGNSAESTGGGMIIHDDSDPTLNNVTISDNTAGYGGGIAIGSNSSPSLTNVMISGNSAMSGIGGLHCFSGSSSPSLANVTITENSASFVGGFACGTAIFDSNNRSHIYSNYAGFHNDVGSTGHIILDTFTVMSPTIYHAPNGTTFDILNAIQTQVNADLYVSPTGDDANDGLSWSSPLKTITAALSKIQADSSNPRTIYLAPGVYSPNTNGEPFTLTGLSHVSIKGSGEDNTILDANGQWQGLYFSGVEGVRVEALTVRNGVATGDMGGMGGGIYCIGNPELSLVNMTITGNSALDHQGMDGMGGGIFIKCPLNLENVTISDNTAGTGGALYLDMGGGITPVNLTNVIISDNTARTYSGGIGGVGGDLTLLNVTMTGNSGINDTVNGVISLGYTTVELVNSIVWNNTPEEIFLYGDSHFGSTVITSTYSDIQGGQAGIITQGSATVNWLDGNLDADPLFVDAANGNYRLSNNSPAIDAGTSTNAPDDDIEGMARPQGAGWDMGAYEFSQIVSIYALAFDGESTAPTNLSPLFQETMDGIVAATEGASGKRAIVLVDQDGEADTRIFEVVDGVVTPIVGLPDGNGLLSSALNEYDMTDGSTLGGFLKWTLDEYATSATKTSFSYVSHGTFLAPAVDLSTIFTDTMTLNHRSAQSSPLFPLPSTIYVKSALTDHYPQAGLITPHELQVALDVGTNGGSNALDVLDLVHCFSASIEEFYELSNAEGTPYSEMMLGSPNYSYFAPEMLGRALEAVDAADDAATMANAIMSAYDEVIDEADQADGDADVEHPRTLVALESSKVPPVKSLMDEMAWYLMQEFASNPTATKDKLAAAYSNANAYYDTTYCAPQDWELAAPDGLVDIEAFMSQVANQFGTLSGTGLRALQVAGAVNQAVISHSAHNGTPWFAAPLTPTWTLSGANISGLALYADLEGVADGTQRDLSWHARFYTDTMSIDTPNDNPHPYLFVQGGVNGQTWGDVFNRFWHVKQQTEGVTTRTSACLADFPSVQQEGELSVEELIFPQTGTVYNNYPSPLAATIHAAQTSTNPLVRFNVYDASNTLIFSDTVAAGYLVTGTHYIEAAEPWIPSTTGSFRLEVLVDADNRFLEVDESNNSATMTDIIFTGSPFEMSATTLNNRQWFDSRTIDLDLNSSQALDFLVVQIYEYVSGVDPNTQVPSTPHQVVIPSPSLPNVSFDLPPTVNPGPITLHLWGIAGGDINQGLVKVTFNYAPSNRSLGTGSDYYLFDGAAGDAISITLTVNSGNANLYIWQPGNLWTAQMVNVASGQGTIGFDPALAGEYLVMVEGLTAGTQYTISSLRNGQAGGLAPLSNRGSTNSSTTAVTTVQKAKPTFIEPIPDIPSAQLPATIASSVTLQGRNDVPPPHPRWSVPLNVSLTIPGESSPSYTFTPTTDDYGRFTITGIEPGSYEVRVKKASSLQTFLIHQFSAGSNNLDVGTLYEGDANNDNYITILDFSMLASAFGICQGDADFDARADFNGDGCITILDFSLLASNFGEGGDQQPPREAATSEASLNGAALLVNPLTNRVNVGDIFTATVLIDADNQAIDGAQANLNFDPAVVEVKEVSGGQQLPLELINKFDNKQGRIDFAAGTLTDFPSGAAIELLRIQFKALAATEGTALAFQFDAPRQSDITFGGSSRLSAHTNGTIIIEAAPTSITLDSFDAAKWQRLPLMSVLLLALMAIGSLLGGWRYRRS